MVSSIDKMNMFNAVSGFKPLSQTPAVGTGTTSEGISRGGTSPSFSAKSNLFAGKTVGINDNVTGTSVFATGQAGKNDALLGKQFQAIG